MGEVDASSTAAAAAREATAATSSSVGARETRAVEADGGSDGGAAAGTSSIGAAKEVVVDATVGHKGRAVLEEGVGAVAGARAPTVGKENAADGPGTPTGSVGRASGAGTSERARAGGRPPPARALTVSAAF